MRFVLLSLLVVLGCGPAVTGGSSEGGGGGSGGNDGHGGTGQSGTGGSGSGVSTTGGTSGAGGNTGAGGGSNSCLPKICYSESHVVTHLKPDSTWMGNGDPTTVDCPPLSELQYSEPGVCFMSEPTVEDPGDGMMCCYTMSVCCL
jgi:hypothetical protein